MEPYLGEIRMFGGIFAPLGWMFCDGTLLPISGNDALFALIGTTYGGDGQSTFALPDLRGRWPVHVDATGGYPLGSTGGAESVTLAPEHLPPHSHTVLASAAAATGTSPAGTVWAATTTPAYLPDVVPTQDMASGTLAPAGSSLPHENRPPYAVLTFIIAVTGTFPQQP
jgi:microcystin-dependent protein